jgi:hypothetical protein
VGQTEGILSFLPQDLSTASAGVGMTAPYLSMSLNVLTTHDISRPGVAFQYQFVHVVHMQALFATKTAYSLNIRPLLAV